MAAFEEELLYFHCYVHKFFLFKGTEHNLVMCSLMDDCNGIPIRGFSYRVYTTLYIIIVSLNHSNNLFYISNSVIVVKRSTTMLQSYYKVKEIISSLNLFHGTSTQFPFPFHDTYMLHYQIRKHCGIQWKMNIYSTSLEHSNLHNIIITITMIIKSLN